ncbi:MAG: MBOAT family protein [Bacteroidia bacterium]|nr:MBOAT family protein [Bacteroidia bacterium]
MLFNTLQFFVFFVVVTLMYFLVHQRWRWLLLLLASCYFYMAFVPVYILILGGTIVVDYIAGILIENAKGPRRKLFLLMSLLANGGVLAVFKYYHFLNEILTEILAGIHQSNPLPALKMLLPIGLSFHTFQAISYTIEVYRGKQKAERHFGIYALYVMFYPQLVAGPIERPQNLIHQFYETHRFDYQRFKSGIGLMLWGLFKKVVIADRLSMAVDAGFANPHLQGSEAIWIAVFFYAFQIYCDFSGYSDIAIGAARIMGFDLMLNFNAPYFSPSIPEFWRRWHISLSTWFKDYVYVPLGGNRTHTLRWMANLLLVFLLSGLWHGANVTFLIWGGVHGVLVISYSLFRKQFPEPTNPTFWNQFSQTILTFFAVMLAWVLFRAPSLQVALEIYKKLFLFNAGGMAGLGLNNTELVFSFILIALLMAKDKYLPNPHFKTETGFWAFHLILAFCCYLFGVFNLTQFIYFQF